MLNKNNYEHLHTKNLNKNIETFNDFCDHVEQLNDGELVEFVENDVLNAIIAIQDLHNKYLYLLNKRGITSIDEDDFIASVYWSLLKDGRHYVEQ